jgi:hypothetical protein
MTCTAEFFQEYYFLWIPQPHQLPLKSEDGLLIVMIWHGVTVLCYCSVHIFTTYIYVKEEYVSIHFLYGFCKENAAAAAVASEHER